MSDMIECPSCERTAPLVASCETCGATWEPGPETLSGRALRASCEAYLREHGWEQVRGGEVWRDAGGYMTFVKALDVQWARDGIGGAS